MGRSRLLLVATAVVVVVVTAVGSRRTDVARFARPVSAAHVSFSADDETVLRVPHILGSITLDGDTDDPGWTLPPGPARTHDFRGPTGAPARPFSEVRALWGDGHLYLSLYAADLDIESGTDQPDGPLWLDDSFRVTFSRPAVDYVVEVSPKAVVTDWIRGPRLDADFSWNRAGSTSRMSSTAP